jgi:hypothetical protein
MSPGSSKRQIEIRHHLDQGVAWLDSSDRGSETTLLTYAAFEFRLAIERLAIQYWAVLSGGSSHETFDKMPTFKRIQREIYRLAGHQQEINLRFEFARLLFSMLKIEIPLIAPSLGDLSRHWDECSVVCHVAWSIRVASGEAGLAAATYEKLKVTQGVLTDFVSSAISWLSIHDSGLREIEERYVCGTATAQDVQDFLQRLGAWARFEYPDDRPSFFVGEPIPPRDPAPG